MQAVIIGASGATGTELLKLLLINQQVTKIVALARKPLNVTNSKLETHIIDFNTPTQWEQFVIGDVAFSCLGTTIKKAGSKEAQYKIDYQYQFSFAQAAKKNNIPTFILISALSATAKSHFFYPRMKGELEDAISALHFKSLILFRPGLLSRPQSDRSGEKISEAILCFLNRLGLCKNYQPLKVNDLAQLMLEYAINQSTAGKIIIETNQISKLIEKKS